ncbi:hypothetical protein Acid345_4574 [Candidatus Koribacter versatilis Ellin345]|uniref:Uncharacterized protein n=1 Tax=Koribacter versatilis (strain Ellin345) TaxID=204669 RepID=Q1IHS6_KORVE|nr:hypothetical protein [Candidatus Koribacter versatilis]ABF43574.1 hypothetical protein Acid345_4574 [Candidatus Koribacter versatilis Ellin345]
MTLFEAKEYDPSKDRKKRVIVISIIVVVIVLGVLIWHYRYWPYEHVADKFFSALEQKDYEKAYGVWFNDPDWKQHPDQHKQYNFNNFYLDWGPGGEWGLVKEHKIYTTVGGGTGVTVVVIVNGRSQAANVWVEKKDKTMSFPPREYEPQ